VVGDRTSVVTYMRGNRLCVLFCRGFPSCTDCTRSNSNGRHDGEHFTALACTCSPAVFCRGCTSFHSWWHSDHVAHTRRRHATARPVVACAHFAHGRTHRPLRAPDGARAAAISRLLEKEFHQRCRRRTRGCLGFRKMSAL